MGWAVHVAHMGKDKIPAFGGKDGFESLGVVGRIILKWIVMKHNERVWGLD